MNLKGCHLKEKEVTPVEDLYQEHGLLNRILLIYEELIQNIDQGYSIDFRIPKSCAEIIRSFIEDYHEKNEENYIFPIVKKCPQFRELVDTLIEQHQIGRVYTDKIRSLSTKLAKGKDKGGDRVKTLTDLSFFMKKFVTMYRAHESREDTIIFRAFHELEPDKKYKKLGEMMESIEKEKFGEDDYEKILSEIENMEDQLGINDLNVYS